MILKNDLSTVVVLGGWNKYIFNPEWVNKFLLPGEELKAEFPINVDGSQRISGKDVRLAVVGNQLIITSIYSTDDVYTKIQELLLKIIDYLPHTPLFGFGINFNFETNSNHDLLRLVNSFDKDAIIKRNGTVENTLIRRNIKLDGYTINLSIVFQKELVNFDFNYHYNISSVFEFKEVFTNKSIIIHKNHAIGVLKDIYKIED
jgi:hypothetical protein